MVPGAGACDAELLDFRDQCEASFAVGDALKGLCRSEVRGRYAFRDEKAVPVREVLQAEHAAEVVASEVVVAAELELLVLALEELAHFVESWIRLFRKGACGLVVPSVAEPGARQIDELDIAEFPHEIDGFADNIEQVLESRVPCRVVRVGRQDVAGEPEGGEAFGFRARVVQAAEELLFQRGVLVERSPGMNSVKEYIRNGNVHGFPSQPLEAGYGVVRFQP